jgi:sulfur carrier protein
MQLTLNGKPYEAKAGATVLSLLETLALTSRVAVAVNGRVSPRTQHATHVLMEGDEVEIIHAVAGG